MCVVFCKTTAYLHGTLHPLEPFAVVIVNKGGGRKGGRGSIGAEAMLRMATVVLFKMTHASVHHLEQDNGRRESFHNIIIVRGARGKGAGGGGSACGAEPEPKSHHCLAQDEMHTHVKSFARQQ